MLSYVLSADSYYIGSYQYFGLFLIYFVKPIWIIINNDLGYGRKYKFQWWQQKDGHTQSQQINYIFAPHLWTALKKVKQSCYQVLQECNAAQPSVSFILE